MVEAKAPPRAKATDSGHLQRVRRCADLFETIAHPACIEILMMLGEGPQNVSELCVRLGMVPKAVSYRLALMRLGGIIEPRRERHHIYYNLTDLGRVLLQQIMALA
jgi:ArsR family transcriptional regulator